MANRAAWSTVSGRTVRGERICDLLAMSVMDREQGE